jgi:hypothetical protein
MLAGIAPGASIRTLECKPTAHIKCSALDALGHRIVG